MLELLEEVGWESKSGTELEEQREVTDVIIKDDLLRALQRLNPDVPLSSLNEVLKTSCRDTSDSLVQNNHDFHKLLIEGVPVEFRNDSGKHVHDSLKLVDFEDVDNNEYLAVNQLTITAKTGITQITKRLDIVLFVNGLPLVVVELKNPTKNSVHIDPSTKNSNEEASAFDQIETYKTTIYDIFRFNELCIIGDGLDMKVGTISSNFERYSAWKTVNGEVPDKNIPELTTLVNGLLAPERLLDVIKNFIVYDTDITSGKTIKKVAAYHQYWAVNKALLATKVSVQPNADHKAGVVWHTQGSGKSLSMLFYCSKLIQSTELKNPTIVVITDRIDLDGQLFNTFCACRELLRQDPVQAKSRSNLRKLLNGRQSGGVIFSTIQKFSLEESESGEMPKLTDRENIVVIADEAHRSQYGFEARIQISKENTDAQTVYGNAKYLRDALPNASYIGFTGTPIELDDHSTKEVFGNYIDVYDIQRAVDDGSTVPIYYESRLIDLGLDSKTKEWLDKETDGLFEGEDDTRISKIKKDSVQREAIVGNSERIKLMATDIIEHFSERLDNDCGKAMIVTMSRTIAVKVYDELLLQKPAWEKMVKVVITGSSADALQLQKHIRSREQQRQVEKEFKDDNSELKLVIVVDMWLTGFDVPSLGTMYLDKPLKSHNLMQAIARVNRVYPGKVGGLVVDYLGVASALRDALNTYTESGGEGKPTLNMDDALNEMQKRFEVVVDFLNGSNWNQFFNQDTGGKMAVILQVQNFILDKQINGKRTADIVYCDLVADLVKAFKLCIPDPRALEKRVQVAFFEAVKTRLLKLMRSLKEGLSDYEYREKLRQIVDKAITPGGVIDVFAAVGLEKPSLEILSDEFLSEIKNHQEKSVAAKALEQLLKDEVKRKFGRNIIKQAEIFGND
jgi:type I restriction enzyme R subunit